MLDLVIGDAYKLKKLYKDKHKDKPKIIQLKSIDKDNKLLIFDYKFFISFKKHIVIRFDDKYNYFLNDKKVVIEEIPYNILNSTIEQYRYINGLSDEIKKSIITYTSNQYTAINKYLDNNCLPYNMNLSKIISDIDLAFKNAPVLKDKILLFRGLHLPNIFDKKRNSNMVLSGYKGIYKGFISTSLLVNSTYMFNNKTCCTLRIDIPKNSKCLFIEFISEVPDEQEVLLQRNSILAITSFGNNIINTKLVSISS